MDLNKAFSSLRWPEDIRRNKGMKRQRSADKAAPASNPEPPDWERSVIIIMSILRIVASWHFFVEHRERDS